jgi:c-di-GMP-binding flagellar brake protein YcgR
MERSMTEFRDRRCSPRVKVPDRTLAIATATRTRVIDVSQGGVLAEAAIPERWTAVRLTMAMPAGKFSSEIAVRHQSGVVDLRRFGAEFTEMSEASRQCLEQFLAKAAR